MKADETLKGSRTAVFVKLFLMFLSTAITISLFYLIPVKIFWLVIFAAFLVPLAFRKSIQPILTHRKEDKILLKSKIKKPLPHLN